MIRRKGVTVDSVGTVHPIEQLRYVARASGADAGLLVQEAASALGVFRHDRPGLVTAPIGTVRCG